jgi:antitoxin (DNA-binding transcriptional repressor) of toxin-antitoxin stability system
MTQVTIAQAVQEMERLLDQVKQGHDVIIIGEGGEAFKLIALPRHPRPVFGSARGQVEIHDDFDAPIDGFEEYAP